MVAATDCIEGRTREYVCEHRMWHKDGTVRWFLTRGRVLRDEDGKPTRMVGTDADITNRKQAEDRRALLEERLQRAHEEDASR